MTTETETSAPESKPSGEADSKPLALAREEGDKYLASLEYMTTEVANVGAKARAGDYIVAFAQEKAEGMYHLVDGVLTWMEAAPETNCHIEIAVLDAGDRRFIPGLTIECTLSQAGREVVRFKPEFLWHPGLFHYGRDVKVPASGLFDLKVMIAAPTFPRHDKLNGKRYREPVDVTFDQVPIQTGRG